MPSSSETESADRRRVLSGVRWSAASTYANRLIGLVVSLVLARLLEPADFGLLGMAYVVVGFMSVLQRIGLGSAIVQRKEISESLLTTVFTVTVGSGVLMSALIWLGAPLISAVYAEPRVGFIAGILSLSFPLSTATTVHRGLLTRELRFRAMATVQFASAAISGIVAVVLASLDWGVNALVAHSLLNATLDTIGTLICRWWTPSAPFSWQELRQTFRFGAGVVGFDVINYLSRNGDDFIIGKYLGQTALGYYSLAYRLMLMPRDMITAVVGRVLFPALSQMQDNEGRLVSAYSRAASSIAFLSFPAMVGLMTVADLLVPIGLGEKWRMSVPVILILAPVGMVQSVGSSIGQLFLAKGRSDIMLLWAVICTPLYLLSFVIGVQWGIIGVAASYAIVATILFFPPFIIAKRIVRHFSLTAIFGRIGGILLHCMAMAAAVLAVRAALSAVGAWPLAELAFAVVVGVASYVGTTWMAKESAWNDIDALLPESVGAKVRQLLS